MLSRPGHSSTTVESPAREEMSLSLDPVFVTLIFPFETGFEDVALCQRDRDDFGPRDL